MAQLTSGRDMKLIVKRKGHSEAYDAKKLYASVYAACLAVAEPSESAEMMAERVCSVVDIWLAKKHEVTSNDLRRIASGALHDINLEAAHLYHKQRIFH
jgi:transcriptional regulator NrdR family protein